jgi:Holliday junction resolvase
MNNKRLGTAFEREMCEILAAQGYWVHFIVPDARGAQPFDIIAVKDGKALAIDCKTCAADSFSVSRLEDNQIMAFNKWRACGNETPVIAVKHAEKIYYIDYSRLLQEKRIKLEG